MELVRLMQPQMVAAVEEEQKKRLCRTIRIIPKPRTAAPALEGHLVFLWIILFEPGQSRRVAINQLPITGISESRGQAVVLRVSAPAMPAVQNLG